jgi:cytochrome c oxidase assembly protein Cox11
MFELVAIFLATFLIAAASVWLYRLIAGRKGFNQAVVTRRSTTAKMKLRAQQGFISLIPAKEQRAKSVRLRNSTGSIRAPWGW